MPRWRPNPAIGAVLLALGALLLLAGCGDKGNNPELLSEKTANSMLDDLEAAQEAFDAGDCAQMQRRLDKVLERVNALGGPISKPLKLNLREGTQTLMDEAEAECGASEEPAPAPEPEPAPAPEPETPQEEPDSPDEEEPTTPEDTNPDQPNVPAPEPEPAPAPEPTPTEPDVEPPQPAPTPTPPSGGVGPSSSVGGN